MLDAVITPPALFLCWLFARAAWHKLASPDEFVPVLQMWGLSERGARASSRLLGVGEALLAFALLVPTLQLPGLFLAMTLLTGYALAMSFQLINGRRRLRCGCGGSNSKVAVSRATVVRNIVLVSVAGLVAALSPIEVSGLVETLTVLLTAVFMVLLYESSEKLIENSQRFAGVL